MWLNVTFKLAFKLQKAVILLNKYERCMSQS